MGEHHDPRNGRTMGPLSEGTSKAITLWYNSILGVVVENIIRAQVVHREFLNIPFFQPVSRSPLTSNLVPVPQPNPMFTRAISINSTSTSIAAGVSATRHSKTCSFGAPKGHFKKKFDAPISNTQAFFRKSKIFQAPEPDDLPLPDMFDDQVKYRMATVAPRAVKVGDVEPADVSIRMSIFWGLTIDKIC